MEDITNIFAKRLIKAKSYRSKWDKDMETAFAYYAKRQWDDKDITRLKAEQRPALTFNVIRPIVNVVSGSEISNRFEPRFLPRNLDGQPMADMLSDIVKYVRDQSNAEQHDSNAFRDALICGVGCVEFFHDYEDSVDGKTKCKRIPINEMYWDPSARDQNLLDAKYIIRERWMDEDEFAALFPDVEERGSAGYSDGTKYNADPSWSNAQSSYYDALENKVKVYEYQWYETETRYLVEISQVGPQGPQPVAKEILEPDFQSSAKEKLLQLQSQASGQEMIVSHVALPMRRYKKAFFLGTNRLIQEGEPPTNNFSYLFITGYADQRDRETYWHGIVHDMKDPQEWANKFFSQIVHIVATNPKGAIITPQGFFDNIEDAQRKWSMPNSILESNSSEVKNKIEIAHGQYPTGIDQMYQHSLNIFGSVTGINPAYFVPGVDNLSRTANTAIQSVQKQSMMVLAVIFDGLRLYRREQGKILLNFIKDYMPEGSAVRITDENGMMSWQPFRRDLVEGVEYEIIVEESPTSPSVRHEFWNSLIQTRALDVLMQSGILTGDIIADLMPEIPATVRERMKQNYMMMQQAMAAQQAAPV